MRAGHTGRRTPGAAGILIHIDFDGDLFSMLIADVPKAILVIEVSEKGIPRLLVARFCRQRPNGLGDHIINRILIGVIIVPPRTCLAVPACCGRLVCPDDAPVMDAFCYAHRAVRRLGW